MPHVMNKELRTTVALCTFGASICTIYRLRLFNGRQTVNPGFDLPLFPALPGDEGHPEQENGDCMPQWSNMSLSNGTGNGTGISTDRPRLAGSPMQASWIEMPEI
jgi:hypothetical protein